jgi:hypothetical protein
MLMSSNITGRKKFQDRHHLTYLKLYFVGVEEPFGERHLHEIINRHPDFFRERFGMASVYGAGKPGATIRIYDPLPEEGNCMWRAHNYEGGKRLPPEEEGACGRELEIFGDESRLLRVKYRFDVSAWMNEFAVDIDA